MNYRNAEEMFSHFKNCYYFNLSILHAFRVWFIVFVYCRSQQLTSEGLENHCVECDGGIGSHLTETFLDGSFVCRLRRDLESP